MDDLKEIKRVIDQGKRFLITTHLHPDGDAVGSSLALKLLITQLGKEAVVIHREKVPFSLKRMPDLDNWSVTDTLPEDYQSGWDALFVVECPRMERAGYTGLDRGFIVNIDHHISNTCYGDINVVDAEVPCVGMLIWDLAINLYGLTLTPPMTDYLYVALVTDTGQFCYANSNKRSFEMAAHLVEHGTRPDKISSMLYEGYPSSVVRLKGLILSTLELFGDGRIAVIRFPNSFLSEAKAEAGDAEGVIDEPRKIGGVEVALLLREQEDGSIKVSMRSQGGINVETIAQKYGGGGHHNAAGFVIDRDMEEAKSFVLRQVEDVIDNESERITAR